MGKNNGYIFKYDWFWVKKSMTDSVCCTPEARTTL